MEKTLNIFFTTTNKKTYHISLGRAARAVGANALTVINILLLLSKKQLM